MAGNRTCVGIGDWLQVRHALRFPTPQACRPVARSLTALTPHLHKAQEAVVDGQGGEAGCVGAAQPRAAEHSRAVVCVGSRKLAEEDVRER